MFSENATWVEDSVLITGAAVLVRLNAVGEELRQLPCGTASFRGQFSASRFDPKSAPNGLKLHLRSDVNMAFNPAFLFFKSGPDWRRSRGCNVYTKAVSTCNGYSKAVGLSQFGNLGSNFYILHNSTT
jgi:hypothetical protein